MYDQANDVHAAFVAFKNDKRFSKSGIGLLGHSEGGAAVAIEASRNSQVEFLIILSASGINGDELNYKQATNKISEAFPAMKSEQKKKVFSDFRKKIEIVAENRSIDSMKFKLAEFIRTRLKEDSKFIGKQTFEQACNNAYKIWLNKHRIAYIQYQPKLYYSKIKGPALVMFGTFDEMLDYKENLASIEKIFRESGKKNYKIVAIDSLNHSYRKADKKLVGVQSHPERLQNYKESKTFSPEAWGAIVKWMKLQ